MKSISIYALTRNQNKDSLSKLERQLSGREYFLKIREWELQSMKAFCIGITLPAAWILSKIAGWISKELAKFIK